MGTLSHSLSAHLILLFMGCFGDCLNHRFSLIKQITRITGSLWEFYQDLLSPSLFTQLIGHYPFP